MLDVIIIGSGVIGASIAKYLSHYNGSFLVLEKEEDIAMGTSKANSGISHAGFDCNSGSLKAKFNVLGNEMMASLSRDLDFPYVQNGAFVLAFTNEDKMKLEILLEKGLKNNVKDLSIISGSQARKIEPKLSEEVKWALHAKTSGIVSPYELTIALCENAYANKVEFSLNSEVTNITKCENYFDVEVNGSIHFQSKMVINCAGLFSDKINEMLGLNDIKIIPRKGEYLLLDKSVSYTNTTLFQTPTKMGKGILVTPTTHSNTLLGPTASDIDDKSDTKTTIEGLNEAWNKATLSIPTLNKKEVITQFSGLRSHPVDENGNDIYDFIIGPTKVEGFYRVCGIESPGLTSAPAIGKYVAEYIKDYLNLTLKSEIVTSRKGIKHICKLDDDKKKELIKENPLYAHVICRCEEVTEAEIIDSINRPLGARSLDGVKRRTRSGMGRCQMGFCTPKIMEILARQLKIDVTDVTKSGKGSNVVMGKVK